MKKNFKDHFMTLLVILLIIPVGMLLVFGYLFTYVFLSLLGVAYAIGKLFKKDMFM